MGIIATIIGKYIAWPVIGSLVPGFNPKLVMALAGLLLVLVAIGGPAGAVWLHMRGAKHEAVKVANAACELRVAESAAASAQALSNVLATIQAGEADAPAVKTKVEASTLCKKSKLCRENGS